MNDEQTKGAEVGPLVTPEARFSLVPRSLGEAVEYAKLIATSGICPAEYRGKPQDVLAAVMMGAELGISPFQALQSIALINGRATMWGDMVLALVRQSGQLASIREREPAEALVLLEGRCETLRVGQTEPLIRTFSYEQAKRAGLTTRGGPSSPWALYPGRMLMFRARAWNLRDGFGDVLRGLHVREEVEDYPPPAPPLPMPKRVGEIVESFVSETRAEPPVGAESTAAVAPAEAPPPPPPPGKAARMTGDFEGLIHAISGNTGVTGGKPWTRTIIELESGMKVATFSEGEAAIAADCHAEELPVRIEWEETGQGKRLTAIEPAR